MFVELVLSLRTESSKLNQFILELIFQNMPNNSFNASSISVIRGGRGFNAL